MGGGLLVLRGMQEPLDDGLLAHDHEIVRLVDVKGALALKRPDRREHVDRQPAGPRPVGQSGDERLSNTVAGTRSSHGIPIDDRRDAEALTTRILEDEEQRG
jgi:hypothetical protein